MSEDCLFCKIVQNEIPSKKVFENDSVLAFLDINPISEGHTIVIPKNHYPTLGKVPDKEISELFKAVKTVAKKIYANLKIDGYNIVMNNHSAAGQMIEHAHIHIVPRTRGDGLIKLEMPKEQAEEEELEKVLKKIKS